MIRSQDQISAEIIDYVDEETSRVNNRNVLADFDALVYYLNLVVVKERPQPLSSIHRAATGQLASSLR